MLIIDEKNHLMKTIEFLRKEMVRIGTGEGFASNRTIMISQKLDAYILKYQYLKKCQ